jgi:hypothetical protein
MTEARKRTRSRNDGASQEQSAKQERTDGDGGKGGAKNRDRNRRRNSRNRRRKSSNRSGQTKQPSRGAGFWGVVNELPEPSTTVRVTDDPAAVARSLGTPHLPGHEKAAEHYFAVVYERAVQIAAAVAAASGLIEPDDLTDD